ncbi:MAG: GldM family protein [Bacteroidetes bacterium]|nr:GldM family protein [Bacteroidota bacterium]
MQKIQFILWNLFLPMLFHGQQVSNESPYVNTDFKKYLYVGFENPVYLSTGKYKSLKIEVSNGTIKKTGEPGKYLITPDSHEKEIVSLNGSGYFKQFEFQCITMKNPEIDFVGIRNDDNMMPISRSEGIYAKQTPLDLDIFNRIDSVRVTVIDSLDLKVHTNIGPKWDSITLKMIRGARKGSTLIIDKIVLTGPDNRTYRGEPKLVIIWD